MNIKIIATIGPSCNRPDIIKKMSIEGMNIARINTKYGTEKSYTKLINYLKNIPDCKILFDIKGLSMIKYLKNQEFDYLAVSFAEDSKQIKYLKKIFGKRIKIISKIETKKGIKNIDSIINASDGIMVARGDLGKNIEYEELPIFQKVIIKKCNKKKKMVITATEMLLSMVKSRMPERAEVSDVANAILDGSNALMLSEETAIGKHPIVVVKTMRKIIDEIQENKGLL